MFINLNQNENNTNLYLTTQIDSFRKKMQNCIPYDICKLSAIFHQIFNVFFIKTNYAKVASFGYF